MAEVLAQMVESVSKEKRGDLMFFVIRLKHAQGKADLAASESWAANGASCLGDRSPGGVELGAGDPRGDPQSQQARFSRLNALTPANQNRNYFLRCWPMVSHRKAVRSR